MLRVMRDPSQPVGRRDDMAKAAAPFCHSRLSSVEHSGEISRPTVIRAPAVWQPSTSGGRNTRRVQRRSTDGGRRESRHCVHDRVGASTGAANGPAGVPGVRGFLRRRPRRRQDGRDARRMGLPCRSSRKERCRVDGPSRAGAAPRDDRAKPANLWAGRGEIQRSGQNVALAERSSTSLCLSRARRRRGCLPGAQLHASVCRGAGHVPERLAGSEADGNVALWRGCTLRVSGNRQPRRARAPMGQGVLHRPQSCRMGSPKVHV